MRNTLPNLQNIIWENHLLITIHIYIILYLLLSIHHTIHIYFSSLFISISHQSPVSSPGAVHGTGACHEGRLAEGSDEVARAAVGILGDLGVHGLHVSHLTSREAIRMMIDDHPLLIFHNYR